MYLTMSRVRGSHFSAPDGNTAAYHVILPSGNAPLEIPTPVDGRRISADAVTALFIGPLTVKALMAQLGLAGPSAESLARDSLSAACAPLVLTLTPPMTSMWSPFLADTLIARARVLRQPIMMSTSTLLHAQRLRLRVAACAQADTPGSVAIRADYEGAASFLDALLGDFLALDPASLFRRGPVRRRTLVDRARHRLVSCPGLSHRLSDVAESLGVSAFHFARMFRAETTLSVHQYLLRVRMARALQRLSCSDVDLSRLALDLGFSSHSHFSATFHKQFGASPAQVRGLLARERRGAVDRPSWGRDPAARRDSYGGDETNDHIA